MNSPLALLKFTAKVLVNGLAGGLPVGDFLVDVVPDFGRDIWDAWKGSLNSDERRIELATLAQIPDRDAPDIAKEVTIEVAGDQSKDIQELITGYLTMMPAVVRRSFQRHSDPSGTSVPNWLVLRSADDLLQILPPRLPKFRPGVRPEGLDWELVQFLGMGGFGEVWKARHLYQRSRHPVAIKFCTDSASADLLRNEVELLEQLTAGSGLHPGIVPLVDTHLNSQPTCLMYEFIEGGDLTGLIQDWHRDGRGPSSEKAAEVICQLAEIAGFAHRLTPPVVHRDLKPANILVVRKPGGHTTFKITDFGIGGIAAEQTIRMTRQASNRERFILSAARGSFTPLYASPQQVRGSNPDPRDDVFALGVIWYQLLTGRLDEGRPGGVSWMADLKERGMSKALIDVLVSCFEDRPERRSSNGGEMAAAISAAHTSKAVAPQALPPAYPVLEPSVRTVKPSEKRVPSNPIDQIGGPRTSSQAGSIRVHELARDLGMKSQELLERIQKWDLEVKSSSLARLDSAMVARIRELYQGENPLPPASIRDGLKDG